jgi:hypothetical protein
VEKKRESVEQKREVSHRATEAQSFTEERGNGDKKWRE